MYKRISITLPERLALALKEKADEGEQSMFIRQAIEVKLLDKQLEKVEIYKRLRFARAKINKLPQSKIQKSINKGRL